MNNCKNCGNKIFEEKMGNFKCYLKERACVRSEIDFGCPDWSEKRAIKIEEKPIRVDGATFIPHISEDGIISWTNDQGLPNPKPVQLRAGLDGKDGVDGEDGKDGVDGIGISSIKKTSTNGLIDTYTITYTDGNTSTFTITNGKDGINGSGSGGVVTGITITDITESEEDGGKNIITFSDGSTITVKNGSKGSQGDPGKDGTNGKNGVDGKDGVGITSIKKTSVSGNVDTYTITYTNNSTSTFKVTNGKNGSDGEDGADGKDGTSITIRDITTSTADGGTNIVTFSDGKKLTVKNGADGHTPVKGEDYFTEADKSEMVSAVIASLPKYNGEVVTE